MKKIGVEEAVGLKLFHDLTAILENGYKGVRFKRGHIIEEKDIPVLLSMGKEHIFIEEDDDHFVHEEDAAKRVVEVAVGQNIDVLGPSEGKFTLKAACKGLFRVNLEGLYEINATEDYTFAAIYHDSPVEKGDVLVGARIVPLVTSIENVERAESIAQKFTPVFEVVPYQPLKVGIVVTGSEIYKGRIQDAFEPILRKKLKEYGADVLPGIICPDNTEVIENAIRHCQSQGAQLILITGGMSVDPDDLTPGIIRNLSDEFLFQGLPVQPGNMLTVGKMKETMLIGVPGASMHSDVTSLDLFLPKIFAGIAFTREDAVQLGNGGLSICRHWPLK